MLRQVFLGVFFVTFSRYVFWTLFCRLLDGLLHAFGGQRRPKVIVLGSFLKTFRGPGAHARTVLSLQRELDLEGSGGSENRRFFDVLFRREKKSIRTRS